jgi:hypothetical protein
MSGSFYYDFGYDYDYDMDTIMFHFRLRYDYGLDFGNVMVPNHYVSFSKCYVMNKLCFKKLYVMITLWLCVIYVFFWQRFYFVRSTEKKIIIIKSYFTWYFRCIITCRDKI